MSQIETIGVVEERTGLYGFVNASGRVSILRRPVICPSCGCRMFSDADIERHVTAQWRGDYDVCDPNLPA